MPMLDDLRRQNPALANYSDDQIKSALRQEPQFRYLNDDEFDAYVGGSPQQAQSAEKGDPGFMAGISAGVDQLQAMGGGLLMAAGEATESPGMLETGRDIYQRNMDEASENALGFGFTDIRSPGQAWQWAKYTAGNQLPMLAASVASGGVGGVTARTLAGATAKQAATRIGQALGAGGGSVGMETGSMMGETEDLEASLAHGALAGSLDALTPVRLLRAAGKNELADQAAEQISDGVLRDLKRETGRSTLGAARSGSLTNLITEASTEGLQGLINQHANYWVSNNGESLLANLDEVNVKQIIDEAAAGGLMGGVAGAPAGISERGQARRQVSQIEAARQQAEAQGGDALDQAMAGQQAETSAQGEEATRPAMDPEAAAEVGNQLQLTMGELDDLQNMARGASYQGQTRLRNMDRQLQQAQDQFEAGNLEGARRRLMMAQRLGADLRSTLSREGSAERPARPDGEYVGAQDAPQGPAGLIGQDGRRLPPGDPSTIFAGGPTADQTQYDPQARNVRRDEGLAAQRQGAQRMRDQQANARPQLADQGIVYGQGPTVRQGNANTGMDRPFADPRFAPDTEAQAPVRPDALRGQSIDNEWTAFAPGSGTRGVPRAEMPQVKAENRGALANFLSARGIQSQEETVSADQLKPTQAEFSEARVQAAKEREGGNRAILISSDGHVVDGHHQWLAAADQGESVRAIRLNAPIDEVLDEVRDMPSAEADAGSARQQNQPQNDGLQRRTDGQPFASRQSALRSGYARRAKRQGRQYDAVEVDGGFALQIEDGQAQAGRERDTMLGIMRDIGREMPDRDYSVAIQQAGAGQRLSSALGGSRNITEARQAIGVTNDDLRAAFEEGRQEAGQTQQPETETQPQPTQDESSPAEPSHQAEPTTGQESDQLTEAPTENTDTQPSPESAANQEDDPGQTSDARSSDTRGNQPENSARAEAEQMLRDQGYSLTPPDRPDGAGPVPAADDVSAILAGHEELAEANVIQSAKELPAQALLGMALRGVNPADVRGMYIGGNLYVIADNLDSAQEGLEVAVHEAVGHKGMRAVLGEDLDRAMLDLYRSLPNSKEGRAALTEVRRDYPFLDPKKREDRVTIGEEMVAHMLEKGVRPKAWQKAVAKIRELLRRLFPMVGWTYTDVLALGEKSRDYLRRQQDEADRESGPLYSISRPGDTDLSARDLAARLREEHEGLKLDLTGRGDVVTVSRIVVAPDARETGVGTEVMQRIAGWADANGKTLALTPSGDFGGSKRRLQSFYKRLGFEDNKGSARDFAISESMYRLPEGGDVQLYSLRAKQRTPVADQFDDLSDAQRDFMAKFGPRTPPRRAMDWVRERWDRAGLKIRQGMVDQHAALRELDEKLYGESAMGENIQRSSWVLARMSNAANGALHAMLHNGRIRLDPKEKVIQLQDDGSTGLGSVLGRLGSAAEIERFMMWIAANRSDRLKGEGREFLFDEAEIAAGKQLDQGRLEDGGSRAERYQEVFHDFQQYRDDVLAVAEQSGIISTEQREMWAEEFYVPFYRLSEEKGAPTGQMATSGLSRQQAYKRLKGGTQNINDLLQNTMMNFHHLLDASLKNQAAVQAVDNAKALGMAEQVPESNRDTSKSTFVMENGKKTFYQIDDPLVFEALTALAHPGMNSTAMKVMRAFKRTFTNLTTTTPQFMAANLIRDSLQAAATNDVSKNAFKNVIDGGRTWRDERTRAQMMASGAAFNFGHLYNSNPDELRAQLTRDMRNAKIVDGPYAIPDVLRAGWTWWNDVNNTAENLNRAAIYAQNREGGELRAAFESRDLIDFSAHGAWPAVRILIDIVPFLNARIQGLDKIYRSGVKPGTNVLAEAFGKGKATTTDKQAAARFWSVAGALTLATVALYLHNQDDEEYQKLEDWQKDTYWFFRAGDNAFFIPKPFEVGAIATMAERITQQFVDDEATGKLFRQRMMHMMTDTFSFSPVPQMMQPALDIYANYDAFTGRPIESMGMERLSPELRKRSSTSKLGEWISQGLNNTVGAIGSPDTNPLALSPVQVDHLIGGYLGQVGTWVAGIGDVGWRAASGIEAPASRWHEYQPVRRFYRDLGEEDRYTRYGTVFYEGLREAGRAYSDVKELREMGRLADAAEVAQSRRDILVLRTPLNRAQRRLNAINKRIDITRRSSIDGELKRQRIDRLRAIKNQIQRALGERVLEARAG